MFNTLYVKSSEIFEHAANTRAKDSNGIHRLPAGDMFLPDELEGEGTEGEGEEGEDKKKKKKKKQKQEGGDGEDVEMKDAPGKEETVEEEDEVVEDTKDNEVEEVLENFSARIMQRDVKVEEVPGGSPARRELKVLARHFPGACEEL